jgi:uncharacterized membrane protein
MKKLKKYLFTGILTLLPISISVFIVKLAYNFLNNIGSPIITAIVGFEVPFIGFLLTASTILLVGMIADNIFGRKLFNFFEAAVSKVPFVNIIYKSVRELSHNLSNTSNSKFSQVVMVNFPNENSQSIGFITKESLKLSGVEKIAIFIPTTPNPTNGFLMFFNPKDVEILDVTVDEAIKIVVSMGVVTPSKLQEYHTY